MSGRNTKIYLALLLVLVVTLAPGNGKIAGNYLDKVAHFALFFLLSWSICRVYPNDTRLTGMLLWTVVLGFLTEFIQQYIPGRNLDFYDGLADTLGVLAAYYLATNFKR